MRRLLIITVAMAISGSGLIAGPPKLVSTSPQFWAKNVDPARQTILSLRFDQRLRPRFYDWFGKEMLSPESNLKTTFSEDHMSCSIDVHLARGKVYVCALNERGFPGVGFQNEKGISLPSTYLVFQTTGNPAPADAPPAALRTSPVASARDVNPALSRGITIVFDKAMDPKAHGFHLLENKVVVDLKKVAFTYSADGKTFTVNYPLKASTSYEVQMNGTQDIGFASTNRVPLWPYHFAFTTGQPY